MLFRKSQAALYERLLKEKDRQIEILADEIDYLRVLLAERGQAPIRSVRTQPNNPTDQPPVQQGTAPYLSEEEEDILALREAGHITDAELVQLREELGLPELQLA